MKHTAEDLKLMQALPLDMKIQLTKDRIRSWVNTYGESGVYVSYSGGKDSTVLMHLVKQDYPDVPVVFCDTGLEYPEVRALAIKNADVVLKPKMKFREVIEKYGYPVVSKDVACCVYWAKKGSKTRIQRLSGSLLAPDGSKSKFNCEKWAFLLDAPFDTSNECCRIMKKNISREYEKQSYRKPFLGMLAEESIKRTTAWAKTGCNAYELKFPQSQPLAFWTEQDILAYILRYDLEIPSVYGDIVSVDQDDMEYESDLFGVGKLKCTGVNRTGCMFCGFGAQLEKSPNRFQRMKVTHPKLWDYCINGGEYSEDGMWRPSRTGLGMGKVLDYIGVPYE